MKCQNRQFTKFISLLKFPGLQYTQMRDLEISKSSIFKKKKKKKAKNKDFGPEWTWTRDPWLKKLSSIHLSYLQLDDQEREKSTKVLTPAVQTQRPATSLYRFCLSSQKRNLFGGVLCQYRREYAKHNSTLVLSFYGE